MSNNWYRISIYENLKKVLRYNNITRLLVQVMLFNSGLICVGKASAVRAGGPAPARLTINLTFGFIIQ